MTALEARRSSALLLLLVAAACRRPVAQPEDPERGRSSARVLTKPEIETGTPWPTDTQITPVYASQENQLPEFPAYALRHGCRGGIVATRLYVGADGNVTGQGDVPDRPVPAGPCFVAFQAAVQTAVKEWRFAPAFRMERVASDDTPVPKWKQTAIAVYVDYEFKFEVSGGKGVVRAR
jgi:hypothetical protein